jgi:eukaryotic-like serine/threonine-protein kinase
MSYFRPHTTINNKRYQIINKIGSGGFGINYLAKDTQTNRLVAVKTLNLDRLEENYQTTNGHLDGFEEYLKELQDKFVNETILLATFDHPNIVKVYPQMFKENDLWCMTMEYIEGKNLAQCLTNNGIFTEKSALKIIEEIGEALKYVHSKNYIHLDIKPHNIILRERDNQAILIDFGLAREYDLERSMVMTFKGTQFYASPEQADGQKAIFTPASDIFSLALTLSTLLTINEPPIIPRLIPPKEINPNISDKVNDAIVKAIELEVNDRPQTIDEWFKMLGIKPPVIASSAKQSPIKLISSKAIDYRKLDQLLAENKWKEADQETDKKILEVIGKKWSEVTSDDFKNFSKEDLQIMDQLWVKYSQGLFGFSVQKQIYINCGGTPGVYDWDTYKRFAEKVGWITGEKWLSYSELPFNTNAPLGNLPAAGCGWVWGRGVFGLRWGGWVLFSLV